MNTTLIRALIGLCLAGLISCKDTVLQPHKGDPPNTDQTAFFPLYSGNTWAYADSIFDAGKFETKQLVTNRIIDFSYDGRRTWWAMSRGEGIPPLEYAAVGDSIYNRSGVIYFPLPTTADTIVTVKDIDTLLVYNHPGAISVPAGVFDSLTVFETHLGGMFRAISYFKPYLGVVRTEMYLEFSGQLTLKSDLLYYNLIQ